MAVFPSFTQNLMYLFHNSVTLVNVCIWSRVLFANVTEHFEKY